MTLATPVAENLDMQVEVGGIQGFSDLATASNTALLRGTGRASLYTHVQAVVRTANDPALPGVLPAIASVFSGTGSGVGEFQISTAPATYFQNVVRGVYSAAGLYPTEANVNLDDFTAAGQAEFQAYVDAGRSLTQIQNYAPIFSPNDPTITIGSFSDPAWNTLRSEALYGGGLALDTPPNFFNGNSQTAAYEAFTIQEIRWALSQGLRVSVIISPNNDGLNFLSDTKAFVATLTEAGAIPTQWVVENYDPSAAPGYVSVVGSETGPGTISSVALWVAQNAPISTYTFAPSGSGGQGGGASAPGVSVWTGSVATAVGGQLISSEDTSGSVTHDYTPVAATIGAGIDALVLSLNEDAWAGDAQFYVTVDGVQVGGLQTASAQRSYGQTQTLTVDGNFSSARVVGLTFVNDAYGGGPSLDRNLYLTGATLDGYAVSGSTLDLRSSGTATFVAQDLTAPTTLGAGPDTLAIAVSGDYALGNYANFTVSVDGVQAGGVYVATASHALGQTQIFNVLGDFGGTAAHAVAIDFLNDAYAPGPGNDRNLYVASASLDGAPVPQSSLALLSGGIQTMQVSKGAAVVVNGTATIGVGPDTLALTISEDAFAGDAEFTVTVDGVLVGGIDSATASHAAGQSSVLDVLGNFGATLHTVAIDFLNDAYAGPGQDRNLYVNSATLDGQLVAGSTLNLPSSGTQSFSAEAITAPVVLGAGPDTLALSVAGDYALGADAQFTVSVDGVQVGGVQTALACKSAGQSQVFDVLGNFGGTTHAVAVNFVNDAWAPGPGNDRNLYVQSATLDGHAVLNGALSLLSGGPQTLTVSTGGVTTLNGIATIGSGPDTLALAVSEDAYAGDAQFSVTVDGTLVGGIETATASHASGQTTTLDVLGNFGSTPHTVAVDFLNDGYGGPGLDRNLYVNGAVLDGRLVPASALNLLSGGAQSFVAQSTFTPVALGSGPDTLALFVSEDYALQANAQFTVSIDGAQVGGVQTALAPHSDGQVQEFDVAGNFGGSVMHTVAIDFLNDAWAPGAGNDRNLYVQNATLDGQAVQGAALYLPSNGTQAFGAEVSGDTSVGGIATIGSGPDTLALSMSEDAYAGDAQYVVLVNGQQVGGLQTATASHAGGQRSVLDVLGNFASGLNTIAIDFLNDAYGGPGQDRNLYVNSATVDGQPVAGSTLNLRSSGTQSFSAQAITAPLVLGIGPDTLALSVAEDYALGADAQFTVSVDGVQVGGVQTALASKIDGQSQVFDVLGNFGGSVMHTVAIDFLNDAWAPGAGNDRNLYVQNATLDGQAVQGAALYLPSNGTQSFGAEVSGDTLVGGVPTVGSGPDTLALSMSEDAYAGDAQYVVLVNGQQVGGLQTATASHAGGQDTVLDVLGNFGAGLNTVAIDFLNDAFGGLPGQDRNLYLDRAAINGQTVDGSTLYLGSTGTQTFQAQALNRPVTLGAGADTVALSMSDDSYQGHAQFTVAIDGHQIGGIETAAASHALHELQTFDVLASLTSGSHTLTVNFLNDAWSPTAGPGNDRNLYVGGASVDGLAVANSALALLSGGPQSFVFSVPAR